MTEDEIRQLASNAINDDKEELSIYINHVAEIIARVYEKGLSRGIECCECINKQKGLYNEKD